MRRQLPPPVDDSPLEGIERVSPHHLESERAVLGVILLNGTKSIDIVGRVLPEPSYFFRRAHQMIYEACLALAEDSVECDIVTVKEWLSRRRQLDEVGGPAYIASLTDGLPRSSNVKHYAVIVREHWLRRQIIAITTAATEDALVGETAAKDVAMKLDSAVAGLSMADMREGLKSARSMVDDVLADLEWRANHRGEITGVPSGWPTLDDITTGFQPGEVTIVAARPSVGKSVSMLNIAVHAARTVSKRSGRRHSTAIFSLEMKKVPLVQRCIAAMTGIAKTSISRGWLNEEQWRAVTNALGEWAEMPVHIDDAGGRTCVDIRRELRRVRGEQGLDLVVIDYLQLITPPPGRKSGSRTEDVANISRTLKRYAQEFDVPFLVLSQLSRGSTENMRPRLTDLRESGSLEQDADNVLFLHRPDHKAGGPTAAYLDKARNEDTGAVLLQFERDCQRFIDGGILTEDVEKAMRAKQQQVNAKTPEEQQAAKARAIARAKRRRRDTEDE